MNLESVRLYEGRTTFIVDHRSERDGNADAFEIIQHEGHERS